MLRIHHKLRGYYCPLNFSFPPSVLLGLQVGIIGAANRDVRQEAVICNNEAAKMSWLMSKLQMLVDEGITMLRTYSVGTQALAVLALHVL